MCENACQWMSQLNFMKTPFISCWFLLSDWSNSKAHWICICWCKNWESTIKPVWPAGGGGWFRIPLFLLVLLTQKLLYLCLVLCNAQSCSKGQKVVTLHVSMWSLPYGHMPYWKFNLFEIEFESNSIKNYLKPIAHCSNWVLYWQFY